MSDKMLKYCKYQLGTQGHEVVDQSLCPASMYPEFVLAASRLLTHAETALVPRVSRLAMSSPRVPSPVGRVFLSPAAAASCRLRPSVPFAHFKA